MRNSAISTKKCELGAIHKTAQIFLIFSAQSLLVKCNKGNLLPCGAVGFKNFFPHVSLGHTTNTSTNTTTSITTTSTNTTTTAITTTSTPPYPQHQRKR